MSPLHRDCSQPAWKINLNSTRNCQFLFPKFFVLKTSLQFLPYGWISFGELQHGKKGTLLTCSMSCSVLVLLGDIGDSQLCLSLSLSAKEDGLGHVDLSQV